MSEDGHTTKWRRSIAENFSRLSRVHERYRQTTDGRTTTYSKREREKGNAYLKLMFPILSPSFSAKSVLLLLRVPPLLFFTNVNVNSRSRSLFVVVRPSVCRLSVTFVHPTQTIVIFADVFTPFGTLAMVTSRYNFTEIPGEPLRRGC